MITRIVSIIILFAFLTAQVAWAGLSDDTCHIRQLQPHKAGAKGAGDVEAEINNSRGQVLPNKILDIKPVPCSNHFSHIRSEQPGEDPPTFAHLASALGANEPANAAAGGELNEFLEAIYTRFDEIRRQLEQVGDIALEEAKGTLNEMLEKIESALIENGFDSGQREAVQRLLALSANMTDLLEELDSRAGLLDEREPPRAGQAKAVYVITYSDILQLYANGYDQIVLRRILALLLREDVLFLTGNNYKGDSLKIKHIIKEVLASKEEKFIPTLLGLTRVFFRLAERIVGEEAEFHDRAQETLAKIKREQGQGAAIKDLDSLPGLVPLFVPETIRDSLLFRLGVHPKLSQYQYGVVVGTEFFDMLEVAAEARMSEELFSQLYAALLPPEVEETASNQDLSQETYSLKNAASLCSRTPEQIEDMRWIKVIRTSNGKRLRREDIILLREHMTTQEVTSFFRPKKNSFDNICADGWFSSEDVIWIKGCRLLKLAAVRRVGRYFRQAVNMDTAYAALKRQFHSDDGEALLGRAALAKLIRNPQSYLGKELTEEWFGKKRRTLCFLGEVKRQEVRISLQDLYHIACAMRQELGRKEHSLTLTEAAAELGIPFNTLQEWERKGKFRAFHAVLTTSGKRKPKMITWDDLERLRKLEPQEFTSGVRRYHPVGTAGDEDLGDKVPQDKRVRVFRKRYVVKVGRSYYDTLGLAVQGRLPKHVIAALKKDYFPPVSLKKKWYCLAEIDDPGKMKTRNVSRTTIMNYIHNGTIPEGLYNRCRQTGAYRIHRDALNDIVNRVPLGRIKDAVGGTSEYLKEEILAMWPDGPDAIKERNGALMVDITLANEFIRQKGLNVWVSLAFAVLQRERTMKIMTEKIFRYICGRTLEYFAADADMQAFFGIDAYRPSLLVNKSMQTPEGTKEAWRQVVHRFDTISLEDLDRIGKFINEQESIIRRGKRRDEVHRGKYLSPVRLKKWREEGLVAASYVYLLGSGHQVYFTPEQEEVLAKVALIRNGKLALLSEREAKNLLEVMKTRFSEEDDKVWLDELCADMGSAHRQAIIRAVEHGLVDNLALLQEALTIIANISSKSQLILTERLSSQSQATEDPPTLAHLASALGANEPANAAASANAGNVHPGGVQWFGESHGAASGRANAASEQWKQIKCQLGMEQNL